jgi:hypothetical protein
MNGPLKVGTAAFLLLLPQFNNADAVGPYDGEWTGTATSTGERCKRGVFKLTIEGQVALGQAKFEFDAPNINGTVDQNGAFGATIGFQPFRGQFTGMSSRERSKASVVSGRLFSGARSKALAIEDALDHEEVVYTALAPHRFKIWLEGATPPPVTDADVADLVPVTL